MVKKVELKINVDTQNQIKPPKKESGLTKLFHDIVRWFQGSKEPLSDRKVELQDVAKEEMEEVFGQEGDTTWENWQEPAFGSRQTTEDLQLEIEVLRDRSAELQEQILAEEKSDPWGIRGMVESVLGKESILKEDKKIIDDLIEAKMANLNKRFAAERGELPDGLELEEISDEEIDLK